MPHTPMYHELMKPTRSRAEANAEMQDQQIVDIVRSMKVLMPGTALVESAPKDNEWTLVSGDYGGFHLKAPGGVIQGLGAGVMFGRECIIEASTLIRNVTFVCTDDRPQLVHVMGTARVQFSNCSFIRIGGIKNLSHLKIGSNCKVAIMNCNFKGITQTVNVVNFGGAAARVVMSGGYVGTGGSTGNITTSAVLT